MNFKRWFSAMGVTCLIVVAFAAVAKPVGEILTTATKPVTVPTVIIDAGHGGLTNTID